MSAENRNHRNMCLDEFQRWLLKQTNGHLYELLVDTVEDTVVIHARSATWHGLQTLLTAIRRTSHANPDLVPVEIVGSVGGRHFVFKSRPIKPAPLAEPGSQVCVSTFPEDGRHESSSSCCEGSSLIAGGAD